MSRPSLHNAAVFMQRIEDSGDDPIYSQHFKDNTSYKNNSDLKWLLFYATIVTNNLKTEILWINVECELYNVKIMVTVIT